MIVGGLREAELREHAARPRAALAGKRYIAREVYATVRDDLRSISPA
jgi:hypothetical protein